MDWIDMDSTQFWKHHIVSSHSSAAPSPVQPPTKDFTGFSSGDWGGR